MSKNSSEKFIVSFCTAQQYFWEAFQTHCVKNCSCSFFVLCINDDKFILKHPYYELEYSSIYRFHQINRIDQWNRWFNERKLLSKNSSFVSKCVIKAQEFVGTTQVMKSIILGETHIAEHSSLGLQELETNDRVALLSSELMTGNCLNKFYDNVTGSSLFYAIPETVFEFYVAPMTPKNSRFIERFNNILSIFRETGLYKYQLSRAISDNDDIMIYRIRHGHVQIFNHKVIQLHDIMSVFYILLIWSSALAVLEYFVLNFYGILLWRKGLWRFQLKKNHYINLYIKVHRDVIWSINSVKKNNIFDSKIARFQ